MNNVLPLPAQSYVYVIGDPNGPQKIGMARDPKNRLASLRTANMAVLVLVVAVPVSRELVGAAEHYAHWLLRDNHARGEWFSVSPQVAERAVNDAIVAVLEGKRAPSVPFGGGGGRKKLWTEHVNLTLPKGAKIAMDAALLSGEDRLDLIRSGIDRELIARGSLPLPPNEFQKRSTPDARVV